MKGIWVPLSAAIAQQSKVDTVANNVANANTPGFKKDRLVFKEYLTALERGVGNIDLPRKEWAPEDFYRSQGGEKAHVKVAASFTVFEQGTLSPTGNPLDIGINGKGFFRVLTSNGMRYTRRGNFSMSQDGVLVSDRGHPVLAHLSEKEEKTDEKHRVIRLKPGRVSINLQGDLFIGDNFADRISLVEFKDISALRKEGGGLFINPDKDNVIFEGVKSTMNQGFIEESNVNTVEEMSELIKANRHFESIQRAIKNYDYIEGKAVGEILKF